MNTLPDRISNARTALTKIETLEDALGVADQAAAAQVWARRANLGLEAQNEAAEIKILAERTAGAILKAMRESGERTDGRGVTRGNSATLNDLGVSKKESSRWQQLADLPEDDVFKQIEKTKSAGEEITTAALVKRQKRRQREGKLRKAREEREVAARQEIKAAVELPYTLHHGSLIDWRPEGVASIITDPPYVGDSIPLYEALRDFAVGVLPAGAPLVVMTWQAILPEVIRALEHDELAYRWTICWRYANNENTVDHTRRVFDCWKPVLVYHKGSMPKDAPMLRDEIANRATDKDFHEWGQSVDGFERLVKTFSQAGDIVCDPFLGGGTTAIAALSQTRRFVGCDIDAEAIATSTERLAA